MNKSQLTTGSLFFFFFLWLMNPGMGRRPSAVLSLCVSVSRGPASAGETRLLPHFSRSHVRTGPSDGAKDQCHMSIFGRRCQSSALQLFSKTRGAIDDNEEGHFN